MGASRNISLAERIAWYCLLATPVLATLAVGHIPFTTGNPFTYDAFIVTKFATLGVLVGIGLASLAVGWATGRIAIRDMPLKWLVLAYFLLAAASTALALNPLTAFFGGSTQRAGMLSFILAGGVFVLATQLVDSFQRMTALARAVMIGGAITAGAGCLQALGYDPVGIAITELWMVGRGTSSIGNPDWAGNYLVIPVVLSATLALFEQSRPWKITASICFALTSIGLLITLTRGAWVATLVGLVILGVAFWRSGRRVPKSVSWTLVGVAALTVVTVVAKWTDIVPRFTALARGANQASGGRVVIWKETLQVIARHPLFGVGPDSLRLGWFPVRSMASLSSGVGGVAEDSHSVPLLLAATLGIPAALVGLAIPLTSLVRGFKHAFPREPRGDDLPYSGWWAALAAACVASVFTMNTILMMTLIALALAVVMTPRMAATTAAQPSWLKWSLSAIALLLAVTAIVFPLMSLVSDYWMAKAVSGNSASYSAMAVEAAPWNYLARSQHAFALSALAINALATKDPNAQQLFDQADMASAQLIAWNPYEHDSYLLRARLLADAGAYLGPTVLEAAIATADQGLAVQPLSVPLRMEKVDALSQLDRWPEIVTTLQDVWDADTNFSQPGTAYAEALIRTGHADEAAPVLARLKSRFSADPKTLAEIARVEAITPTGK